MLLIILRLSLGLFVLLIGVWYCYKRGKEERLKEEAATTTPVEHKTPEPEILVEGTKAQDDTDHGIAKTQDTNYGLGSSTAGIPTNVLGDTAVIDEDTDTPLQIESDVVPCHGPSTKKIKKGWLR